MAGCPLAIPQSPRLPLTLPRSLMCLLCSASSSPKPRGCRAIRSSRGPQGSEGYRCHSTASPWLNRSPSLAACQAGASPPAPAPAPAPSIPIPGTELPGQPLPKAARERCRRSRLLQRELGGGSWGGTAALQGASGGCCGGEGTRAAPSPARPPARCRCPAPLPLSAPRGRHLPGSRRLRL